MTSLFTALLFLSLFVQAEPLKPSRVQKIQNQLAQSLEEELFDVRTNQGLIEISIDPSLGESYKNQLHLWFMKTANTDRDFSNVYIKWSQQQASRWTNEKKWILFSTVIFFLLTFLYYSLNFLSNNKKRGAHSPLAINEEEYIHLQIEKKLSKYIKN